MTDHKSGGGTATAAGVAFQARVAAWVAVHILAEQKIDLWGVGQALPHYLHCETNQAIDDILVGYAEDVSKPVHHAFLQVKHSASLERREDSPLASFLEQCVRQYLANRETPSTSQPWTRKLDSQWDRFIMVVGPEKTAALVSGLSKGLESLRQPAKAPTTDDAGDTENQKNAIETVSDHVRRAWTTQQGKAPTNDELRGVLSLVRIQMLDIDENGRDEAHAKLILRTLVVENSQQVDHAWQTLVTSCVQWLMTRGSADLPKLQEVLQKAVIRLKRPDSIEDDAKKVLAYSESMMQGLQGSEGIEVRQARITIDRECEGTLKTLANTGSVLVLGAPGEGKSAVLSRFARELHQAKRDVILLRADNLPTEGAEGLRSMLGMRYTLPTLLSRWPGTEPAYLVIDALDAARTESSTASIRQLIQQVQSAIKSGIGSRWRVVASIREYDLRRSQPIRALFRGTPAAEHALSDLNNVRHVHVAPLSDAEFEQVRRQSRPLADLYARAGEKTQKLLRTPFNLTLAADLLDSGESADKLREVTTQIELLSRYWEARVEDPDRGDGREALLRDIVEKMIGDGTLTVRKADVLRMARAESLRDLLGNRVLAEEKSSPSGGTSEVLSFPHHILFDYAVERLLLRGAPKELADRLDIQRELALTLRPSLVMHFHHLWSPNPTSVDREEFWETAFEIAARTHVPEVGKSVAPTVAAELFASITDFAPILSELLSGDETRQQTAASLLLQVIVARKAVPVPQPLTGIDVQPWCELVRAAADCLSTLAGKAEQLLLQAVLELLRDIVEEANWDTGQLAATGIAARLALQALIKDPRNRSNLRFGIRPVCRTFESEPRASADALGPLLTTEAVTEYGYQSLQWMAYEIEHIINADPEFARTIYEAAFRYQEQREDTIALSGGVVGLNTTVRQSYDGARYSLSQSFAGFLRTAWRPALRALVVAVDAYLAEKERQEEPPWRTFEFDGHHTGLRRDYSAIWDTDPGPRGYDARPMLQDFSAFLTELCAEDADSSRRHEVVTFLVSEQRTAAWWRRLLMAATAHPGTLGYELRALTWNPVLQTAYDTAYDVGTLIEAIYSRLSEEERTRVEQSMIVLPTLDDKNVDLRPEKLQARLLSCLVPELIVTEEARSLRTEREAANELMPNVPLYRRSRVMTGVYTEDDQLRDQGISPEAERTKRVQTLTTPVKAFIREHSSNGAASTVEQIQEMLAPLHQALTKTELSQEDDQLVDNAWRMLSEVAELAAASSALEEQETVQFLRGVLLDASVSIWPKPRETNDDDDSRLVLVGARFYAAGGLISLLKHLSPSDDEVFGRIEQLAHDKVRSVRIRVAENIDVLWRIAPERTWRLIQSFAEHEPRASVLAALFAQMGAIASARPSDVTTLVAKIFDQWKAAPHNGNLCGECVGLALNLWLNHDQTSAKLILDALTTDPGLAHEATHTLLVSLRDVLIAGSTEIEDPHAKSWRVASFDIFERVLAASLQGLDGLGKRMQSVSSREEREELQKSARSYAQHIDTIGYELYFGSGAYDAEEKAGDLDEDATTISPVVKRRFFAEAQVVLKALGNSGFPSAIHNVVNTLSFLADAVPEGVLLLIGEVLKQPENTRYATDSMARKAVFELLENYLANHRVLLVTKGPCQAAFLDTLDTFVKAGHPEAILFAQRAAEELR